MFLSIAVNPIKRLITQKATIWKDSFPSDLGEWAKEGGDDPNIQCTNTEELANAKEIALGRASQWGGIWEAERKFLGTHLMSLKIEVGWRQGTYTAKQQFTSIQH